MLSAHGRDPIQLAVLGAGASGVMVATQAARESLRRGVPVAITLVDPNPRTGAGVAFATDDPRHLLNAPAGGMSCLPDRPRHFTDWLIRFRDPAATASTFAPRRHYADYLAATLSDAVHQAGGLVTLRRLPLRATACSWRDGRTEVRLSDGSCLLADGVVIATGPLSGTSAWAPRELGRSRRFVADPWAPGALAGPLADNDDVLLVGSGLTAVDLAQSLERAGRTIHSLSRHGLLPKVHAVAPLPPVAPAEPLDGLPLHHLRASLLRHVQKVTRDCGDWRPAIDGLRPHTARLWNALDDHERTDFLRGDRHLWDVHRHRMPPQTGEAITRLRTNRRLRLHTGEVTAVRVDGETLTVSVTGSRLLRVGWVLDCTGPGLRPADSRDPLLADLLSSGLAVPGALGIGLATTPEGRLRARDDAARPLWTIGAHRRGDLWESTAVPEIRQQAESIVRSLFGPAPGASAVVALTHPVVPAGSLGAGLDEVEAAMMSALPNPPACESGATVWLTGLPSAGKSSIALDLAERLRAGGRRVEILDGDEIRAFLSAGLGFSREDRDTNVQRIGMVAEVLARNGVIVLVPVIAPYRSSREIVRLRHDLGRIPFLEVHVATPVELCAERDVKGLYARQAAGEISGLTGVDDPYEAPEAPELRLQTQGRAVTESAAELHAFLTERGLA